MIPIILDLIIIILVYCSPYIFYMYKMNSNNDDFKIFSFKNILFTLFYGLIILISPSMFANTLPFIMVIITIFVMKRNNDIDYAYYKFNELKISSAIKYSLIGYIISIVASMIWIGLLSLLKVNFKQQEVVSMLSDYDLITFIASIAPIVIFAPILEEFVFRFILFEKVFNKFLPKILSAILSSLIFSIIHFSLTAFLVLFTISMINCYLVEKKGFWYAVSLHTLVNFMTTISLLSQKLIA